MYSTFALFLGYWRPFLWSTVVSILLCLTNCIEILPITGIYLLAYLIIVGVLTTWSTFMLLQNFLQQNKPLNIFIPKEKTVQLSSEAERSKCIKELSNDIDRYFISKWFVYITKDEEFNKESNVILEEFLSQLFKVQVSLDNELIVHVALNLYLKHLKEYRRSRKRQVKYSGKLVDLYRYSHTCSTSRRAKDYFLHQLTSNLLNSFINWELSNSLPYQILVSIISRKFTNYLLCLLSNPQFLNYYILYLFASTKMKEDLGLDKYNRVKIINITESGTSTPGESPEMSGKAENIKVTNKLLPIVRNNLDDIYEEVKIYEPKSSKTWYDSLDLDSVQMGEDILDMMGDSDRENDSKEETIVPSPSTKNFKDEVKQNLEGLKTSVSEATASTLHNMKELESTVSSVVKPMSQATTTAFHKIGGLHLQDEAAGVVEGLLDFGRTKFREGLRLTGLQESPTEGIAKPVVKRINKIAAVKADEAEEPVETRNAKIPAILTDEFNNSPEPEYEETADLATTIAKLRSLLEQKSSESSTPSLSPMPTEDMSNKILLDPELAYETDGVMPSFYKFCAKTATGMFNNTLNTIKTALPSNSTENDRFPCSDGWIFSESTDESDLVDKMNKLLSERKAFCTVDTAYEAIDSSTTPGKDKLRQSSNFHFEDELDDFEVKFPIAKSLLDVLCELLNDGKSCLTQEPIVKSVLLTFGIYLEETIKNGANSLVNYWCSHMKIPSESRLDVKSIEMDQFIEAILSGIPEHVTDLLGRDVIREAITLFVSSLQVQKINQDVVMQLLEIICMTLIEGSREISSITT